MKLDIILRTHDKTEVHSRADKLRYPNVSKLEVIKKCVSSLIKSSNQLNIDVEIFCLDDHSSDECKKTLNNIFNTSKHQVNFVELEGVGHNNSSYNQYMYAKNSKSDIIYCVEDDYLHFESALSEMVDDYFTFKKLTNNEIALHPFDDPDNYKDNFIEKTTIIQGKRRHWRTNTYSTYTFLTNPKIVRNNWNIFYIMSKNYMTDIGEKYKIHEGTTLNGIWKSHVNLFTPLPSLALHVQYDENMDKLTDWKKLWDSI